MREIFADSFYWIALANPTDQWHQTSKDFSKANQDATLVTTDEVLTEFLNYFAEAGEHMRRVIAQMCEQMMNHPRIVVLPQTRESFLKGFILYQERPDKGYSLTDCISVCAMRQRSISDALTHDITSRKKASQSCFEVTLIVKTLGGRSIDRNNFDGDL